MEAKASYFRRPWLAHYPSGVPDTLAVPASAVCDLFEESARKYPQQVAVNFYGNRIRYAELQDQARRLATSPARLGVGKGDRVALYLLNTPQFVISYLAALRLGAIVNPVSPVYTSLEVRHQLADNGARTVICQDIFYDKWP